MTLSMDIRQRIMDSYDEGNSTRKEIAERFRVSLGMVKKLIQQRSAGHGIGPLHGRAGRKPTVTAAHRERMREVVGEKPDATLREIREAVGLTCSLTAIHRALAKLGMTYKKRRSAPRSRIAPTSPRPVSSGGRR